MSRQLISTVAAVAALAFTAIIATTITWSAIATPTGPVVMTKANFDRSFADAAAAPRPAQGVITRADAAAAARPAEAVMTKADFDRTFADATAATGPAYVTGVQRGNSAESAASYCEPPNGGSRRNRRKNLRAGEFSKPSARLRRGRSRRDGRGERPALGHRERAAGGAVWDRE